MAQVAPNAPRGRLVYVSGSVIDSLLHAARYTSVAQTLGKLGWDVLLLAPGESTQVSQQTR